MEFKTNMKCDKCGNSMAAEMQNEPGRQLRVSIFCTNDSCEYGDGTEFSKFLSYEDFV